VVSNAHPRALLKLLGDVPGTWRESFGNYQSESATLRMNVALAELPDFTCLPGRDAQPHHRSGIILAPSLAFMDRAHSSAREHGWSRDRRRDPHPQHRGDSLAPPASRGEPLDTSLPAGRAGTRSAIAADAVIDHVTRFAPNSTAVLGRRVLTPLDLERELGSSAATSSTASSP
jgi:phytoene dehydrogenase-like protein